ncbi:MAG: tetratricopeptide repeat protein [Promethearchaeota archaeon]
MQNNNPQYWYQAGRKLAAQKRLKDAEQAFRKAVGLDDSFADAWIGLGAILAAQGNSSGAADAYKNATLKRPDNPDAWYFLGKTLKEQGNFNKAEDALRMALEISAPDWRWRERVTGWISELVKKKMTGAFVKAGVEDLSDITAPGTPAPAPGVSESSEAAGMVIDLGYSSTRDRLAKLVGVDVAGSEGPGEVGSSQGGVEGATGPAGDTGVPGEEEVTAAGEATAASDGLLPTIEPIDSNPFYVEGILALERGDLELAEEMMMDATIEEPGHAKAWAALARLQYNGGNVVEAEASVEASLMFDPETTEAAFVKALMLIDQGRFDEAEDRLRVVTGKTPKNADAWVNLAGVLNNKGSAEEAIACLEKAVEVAPNNWEWLDVVTEWIGALAEGASVQTFITQKFRPDVGGIGVPTPAEEVATVPTPESKAGTGEPEASIQPPAPPGLPKGLAKKVTKALKAFTDAAANLPKIKPGDKKAKAKEVQYLVSVTGALGKLITLFPEEFPLRGRSIDLLKSWDQLRTEEGLVLSGGAVDFRSYLSELEEIARSLILWVQGGDAPVPDLSKPHYSGPTVTVTPSAPEPVPAEVGVTSEESDFFSESSTARPTTADAVAPAQGSGVESQPTPVAAGEKAGKREKPNKWYLEGLKYLKQEKFADAEKSFRKAVEKQPTHAKAWTELGNLLSAMEEEEQAEAAYQKALEHDPSLADAWYNYGMLLVAQGAIDDAEMTFKRATEEDPSHVDAWTNLGGVWKALGKLGDAEEAFRKALEEAPEDWQWTSHVTEWVNELIEKNGSEPLGERPSKFSQATEPPAGAEGVPAGGAAVEEPREVLESRRLVDEGRAFAQRGENAAAEISFRRATEFDPENPDAWTGLGIVLKSQGKYAEAKEAYQQAYNVAPDDWDWRDKVVGWMQEVSQKAASAGLFEARASTPPIGASPVEAFEEEPEFGETTPGVDLSATGGMQEGQSTGGTEPAPAPTAVPVAPPDEVEPLVPTPIEPPPESSTPPPAEGSVPEQTQVPAGTTAPNREGAMALYAEGRQLAGQGQTAAAESKFREAIEADGSCAEAWTGLGVVLKAQGRDSEAETAYKTAVAKDPSYADGWYYLGILLQTTGRPSAAKDAYMRAVGVAPPDWPHTARVMEWISKL